MTNREKAEYCYRALDSLESAYGWLEDAGCDSADLEDLQEWINDIEEVADILMGKPDDE